uniref:VWFA domain-containing protein n=1 Tax=Panagrolaimus davidi TaxID=227884 RepID=A0A914QG96_9BILA
MTHIERIQYGAHNLTRGLILYPWDPDNNQNGLQQAIVNTNQTNSESSILEAFKFLSSIDSGNFNTTGPSSILLFLTDTSNAVLIEKAFRIYKTFIKIHGIQLTFILAGKRTNAYAIRAFEDDAIIYNWQNIGVTAQPDEWDISFAFRCIPPPPTPSKSPYLPCESWIHFGIDDSHTLEKNEFYKETSFISSTIGNINFPKRIAAVGMYFQPVFWNNFDTVEGIQESVDYFPKGDGPYSLKQQFIALSANLQNTETGNIQIAAIIFISDTSDSALANADQIFSQFKPVKITFVLFGNKTDSSKLTKYSSNFIAWNIYHDDQPDNWNNLYYSVYGCQ